MTSSRPAPPLLSGVTAWARNLTPLRRFLRTETGSAAVLLAATVAALAWANIDPRSYGAFWWTDLSFHLGRASLSGDLHGWVNSGLMTFFFLVVAVEARREFDMGELRQRSRLTLPVVAGIGGMIGPVAIYLALTPGSSSAHGWGVAMSTDTAFALGALALVGRRLPDRVPHLPAHLLGGRRPRGHRGHRVVYSGRVRLVPLLAGVGFLALAALARFRRVRYGPVYAALGDGGVGRGVLLRHRSRRGRPGAGPAGLRPPRHPR